jgi:hypothetical protein
MRLTPEPSEKSEGATDIVLFARARSTIGAREDEPSEEGMEPSEKTSCAAGAVEGLPGIVTGLDLGGASIGAERCPCDASDHFRGGISVSGDNGSVLVDWRLGCTCMPRALSDEWRAWPAFEETCWGFLAGSTNSSRKGGRGLRRPAKDVEGAARLSLKLSNPGEPMVVRAPRKFIPPSMEVCVGGSLLVFGSDDGGVIGSSEGP